MIVIVPMSGKKRYCIICGRTSNSTIHLFPVPQDENERQRWMSSLEVYLPKTGQVCSKHFPSDSLGKRKIRKGAVPTKKFVQTPTRSDDFEVIEPYNGIPSASKGSYRYNMLRKSSNNIVTWICVKNETEQCEGRLTSKFGIVLKQFKHTCKRDVTATYSKTQCENAEKDITREHESISVEQTSSEQEGITKSIKSTTLDFKGPKSREIIISKKISSQLVPEMTEKVGTGSEQHISKGTSEHLHEDSSENDVNIGRNFEEIINPAEKSCSNKDQVICRLCLEPNDTNTVTHLTFSKVNSRDEEDSFKKIRAMETAMFINMIETLLPNFDLGMACNPVMCTKCRALLISAYNFVEKCTHNENMIYLYKSELAPDKDKVFCEDVVQNLPLLMREEPPRKKLKTVPHENDESDSSEPSYSITQDCFSETSSKEPSHINQRIIEEPSTIVEEEINVKDCSCDFSDTCEHDSRLKTTYLLENEKLSPNDCNSNKPVISGKSSAETYFFNESFQLTIPSSSSYIVVVPKENNNVDIDLT